MRSIEASGDAYLIYIREFRVYQCQLFLQHKCTQHRPYSCFHWHFMNQRRRRPQMKDGIEAKFGKGKEGEEFNYDPDVYCDIYDEQTGICANGDCCPFVHRNAGDTERKYHPRYYKVTWCFFETDTAGNCTRNGPHCHMAHSLADLRPTISSQQKRPQIDPKASIIRSRYLAAMLEKDRVYNDDTCWNDSKYVVEFYKTEPCKRPPRVCRQGYACPQYHNPRDRRRNPFKYNYRSAPCPNVKQSDEWNEPSLCEKGDSCQLCHSRTEQQFHPDIYKTTRCHDILSNSYCPRGAFCAFAHSEDELKVNRDQNLSRTTMIMTEFAQRSRPSSEVSDSIGVTPPEITSQDDKAVSTDLRHSESSAAQVVKQSFSDKFSRGGIAAIRRNSPSNRDVDVQRQGSFSRRGGKTAYAKNCPTRIKSSEGDVCAQQLRQGGNFLNERLFRVLSPDESELPPSTVASGTVKVRSLIGRRARRKHRTRSSGELYRESLVKTTIGKSNTIIPSLSAGQAGMKIRSLPATFMEEPGFFNSEVLRPDLSFFSLANLPVGSEQSFPQLSTSLPEPLQPVEDEENCAHHSKSTSLRQISLEAMISRNLENIGIEDANFVFEGEEKFSRKALPQGFVRFPNSSDASLVDISGLATVSSCDPICPRTLSSFILLPLDPTLSPHPVSVIRSSGDHHSFHKQEEHISGDEPVAVEDNTFHSDWQIPAESRGSTAQIPWDSLFASQQTFSDLLDSDKRNKLLIQRMNAEITGLKAQVARLEEQLEKALIEREDAVNRLTSFVNSDKALATGRSIWAIQPAERKSVYTHQFSLDKETQTDEYCGIQMD